MWFIWLGLIIHSLNVAAQWIDYPSDGLATLTHYTLPKDYIASCGCTPSSTHYPTAALSQMAYGSSNSYGPACGRCFKLTLINPVIATPPFHPSQVKSIVVKVTDLCPLSQDGWCSGQANKPNAAGVYLNFDLAYPSNAIPNDFFPSDEKTYGYTDFGVWNISYESVSCLPNWSGARNAAALGSVADLGTGVCCPADPTGNVNDTCPSFSDQSGLPPDTATSNTPLSFSTDHRLLLSFVVSCIIILLIPYI
ncbi:hypothetical protein P691DRAFT_756102 [Macrolepiota fuliginosa MF-IS2]|uniref:Expansin-like EG45 domain-containing protein n=1 Tax=Macrolepiota fuliginosa MF-IS2 TaxID=1400762 RepID=A0A9P5XN19_9AGAR|nr:hypothetical protein P691DRAFT_756102 [Macrolepiota fuliginosa MF-IS2]